MSFVDVSEYNMQIINRRGQLIFETSDLYAAWDGTFKGRPVPTGVFVYYITCRDGQGKYLEKKGTVTVLH